MVLTVVLSLVGCVLLFLCIWGVTVTLPSGLLLRYFPADVQVKLKPRIENLPMTFKRLVGWCILTGFLAGYVSLFIIGGIDGLKHGFNFMQFFLRFFTIGAIIKIFDIVCLDYFLLTKTGFFQYYFPETRECSGWKDFGYNRRQQIIQCIFIVAGSIIAARVCAML